jgi:serine/threonine protein kinase
MPYGIRGGRFQTTQEDRESPVLFDCGADTPFNIAQEYVLPKACGFRAIIGAIVENIGRYEILRELGRGAMGVVYSAIDPLIGRLVAIKTISLDNMEEGNHREELTQRLYREAQSAGGLSHPGIITIHDVGEKGKNAYIVMELVEGDNLEAILNSGAPQHSSTLLVVLRKTAEALDYAHGKGIIHRDIKPSNIMICRDGAVKIADFGIAKLSASASMTQSGFVLGTPSYMSPEQARGQAVDSNSDQFSLAVVAYRMLTGRLPFEGPTLTAILAKILWEEPEYSNAGLDPLLQSIFKKALSKNPQLRFANCMEFVQELENAYVQIKSPLPSGVPEAEKYETIEPGPIQNKSTTPKTSPAQQEASAERAQKKSASPIWIACLAVVVLAVAMVAFFKYRKPQEPPAQVPTSSVAPLEKPTHTADAIPFEKVIEKPAKAATAPPIGQQTDVPKSVRTKPEAQSFVPVSGMILWSGNLGKNTVLVIENKEASIGSITGSLPGKPVQIRVEPAEVAIRQEPDAQSGWKRIILYSGSRKYSSITIHWQTEN